MLVATLRARLDAPLVPPLCEPDRTLLLACCPLASALVCANPKRRTASSSWTVSVADPLPADTVRGLLGLESVTATTLSSLSALSQAQVKGTIWLV
jgi:hypothetical protein